MAALSSRLAEIVDALPLRPGMRVIEIGCGPGAAARAVAERVGPHGHVLAVDRSERAVAQVRTTCAELIEGGVLTARQVPAEELRLEEGEEPYDLAFAVRVGALDGRHPAAGALVLERLRAMLVPRATLYIDGGDPLIEVRLHA